MTIRVHVQGAGGRMGTVACEAVRAAVDLELVGTSGRADDLSQQLSASRPDVVVEFTVPEAVERNIETILAAGAHVVSGTTGLPLERAERLGALAAERGLGLLLAPNFAVGVLLMQRFARDAVRWFPDVEIVELHHPQKLDAPSGTARSTAHQIAAAARAPLNPGRPSERVEADGARGVLASGVPIHSVRLPGLLAHQEILFGGLGQMLTVRHDTFDRRAFMPGVLLGVRRIGSRRGLLDSLEPLFDELAP